MLRQKRAAKNGESGQDFCQTEGQLSLFLSRFLSRPLTAVSDLGCDISPDEDGWLCFLNSSGKEFALCLKEGPASDVPRLYPERLIWAANRLAGLNTASKGAFPVLIENLSKESPAGVLGFTILSADGRGGVWGRVLAKGAITEALPKALWAEQLWRTRENSLVLLQSLVRVRSELRLGVVASRLRPGRISECSWECLAWGFSLPGGSGSGPAVYGLDLSETAWGGLTFKVTGEKMDTKTMQDHKMWATLCLGTLEMSLDQALSIRPGSLIEFEKPQVLRGTLQLGGCDWARVEISFREAGIEVEVKELIALGGNKKRVQQETFSPNAR